MQQAGVCSTVYRKRSSIYDSLIALLLVPEVKRALTEIDKENRPCGHLSACCVLRALLWTQDAGGPQLTVAQGRLNQQAFMIQRAASPHSPTACLKHRAHFCLLLLAENGWAEIPAQQGAVLQVAKWADFNLPSSELNNAACQ